MPDLSFSLAILVWGVLPGVLLAWASGVAWSPLERLAAAPGLSLAMVAVAAYSAGFAGWPVAPWSVAAMLAVLCVLVLAARVSLDRRASVLPSLSPTLPGAEARWAPWLVLLLPLAVVGQLEQLTTLTLLPPSLHDGLDHANWFRLIYETRSLDPLVVRAPPVGLDGGPAVYPWGMHGFLALAAATSAVDPVAAFERGLIFISAALPLSVYAFVAAVVGRGWPAVAAAGFSLLFWWLPYQTWGWGGYPLLAGAVAALPVSRLALDAVGARRAASVVASGLCGLGLVAIHPSQAFSALLIAATVGASLAVGRARPWWVPMPFLAALAAAGAVLTWGAESWSPLAEFLSRARFVGDQLAGDPRFLFPWGTYSDANVGFPASRVVGFGVLALVGAGLALFHRTLGSFVALHVVFVLMIPLAASQTWLTSLWYHAPERIWYAQLASLPALAGLGVAAIVRGILGLAKRWGRGVTPGLVWPVVVGALFFTVFQPYTRWASARLFTFAMRNDNLTLTDRRVLEDFDWIRAHVPEGEVLFNAPADWGLPLPFTGRRTAFWSGGPALESGIRWDDFVRALNRGGVEASQAVAELALLDFRHLYAANIDPRMERGGRFSLEADLDGVTGLELAYESSSARIFRIVGDGNDLLGLVPNDRVDLSGFYGFERLGRLRWRWTNGDGRVRISTDGAARECFVRILGPDLGTYEALVSGVPLELTGRGFRIPPDLMRGGTVEVEVRSPAAVPTPQAGVVGSDERLLGVRVQNVSFGCSSR